MITLNGKPVTIQYSRHTPKEIEEATLWAKGVCDRVFSHYTESEMDLMRRANERAKKG